MDSAHAFYKFCFGNTILLYCKLMFDKYELLSAVTKDFDAGLGAGSVSTASRGTKRKIEDTGISMADAVASLGKVIQQGYTQGARSTSDPFERDTQAAALRKEVIGLWRQWKDENDPDLKEYLREQKEKVQKRLDEVEGGM